MRRTPPVETDLLLPPAEPAVIGLDEVGRGCLAGPVVAAAVWLPAPVPGVRDSKRLTVPKSLFKVTPY